MSMRSTIIIKQGGKGNRYAQGRALNLSNLGLGSQD